MIAVQMTSNDRSSPSPLTAADYTSWPVVTDDDRRAVSAVLDRGILSGAYAPEASALEREFAAFAQAKHAILTHSGTSALQLAVAVAKLGAGDEVIVPSYSFVATAMCVVLQGATPVFVDVLPETGLMDPALVEQAITKRTRAIMPVHVHGAPADLDALMAIAKKHQLILLEDAAQAHGATWRGKPVGALGFAGGFSLQSSKNLSGGEGGIFVTNDDAAAELANQVRNFGLDLNNSDRTHYDVNRSLDGHRGLVSHRVGSMYRGNEMMAAFVRSQLKRLPEMTKRAQDNATWLFGELAQLPGVLPQPFPAHAASAHHKVRIRFDLAKAGVSASPRAFRSGLLDACKRAGIEACLWQDEPLAKHPIFQERRGFSTRPGIAAPFVNLEGGTDLAKNYDPARYPVTQSLLDSSIVLFSQTRPFIAQPRSIVERVAKAFVALWKDRSAFAK